MDLRAVGIASHLDYCVLLLQFLDLLCLARKNFLIICRRISPTAGEPVKPDLFAGRVNQLAFLAPSVNSDQRLFYVDFLRLGAGLDDRG
jgi:hypothetical protein